ncbi:MAG: hypothetical protein KDD29_06740 [Flavobacteriales bacterium]|nr:hypothetical protein [Flavobacteriales bacterium]
MFKLNRVLTPSASYHKMDKLMTDGNPEAFLKSDKLYKIRDISPRISLLRSILRILSIPFSK